MRKEWLAVINICAVGAAIMILFISWFYQPHEMVGWGIRFALLLLLLVCPVNVRDLIVDFID